MAALETEFGITPTIARRDLSVLEKRAKRTHGGAVLPGVAQHEDPFQQRLDESVEAKKRLRRAALKLLEVDQTVFLDSSTTVYYAARRTPADAPNFTCLSSLVSIMNLYPPPVCPAGAWWGLEGSSGHSASRS